MNWIWTVVRFTFNGKVDESTSAHDKQCATKTWTDDLQCSLWLYICKQFKSGKKALGKPIAKSYHKKHRQQNMEKKSTEHREQEIE